MEFKKKYLARTCNYCGTHTETSQTNCLSCGGALPAFSHPYLSNSLSLFKHSLFNSFLVVIGFIVVLRFSGLPEIIGHKLGLNPNQVMLGADSTKHRTLELISGFETLIEIKKQSEVFYKKNNSFPKTFANLNINEADYYTDMIHDLSIEADGSIVAYFKQGLFYEGHKIKITPDSDVTQWTCKTNVRASELKFKDRGFHCLYQND